MDTNFATYLSSPRSSACEEFYSAPGLSELIATYPVHTCIAKKENAFARQTDEGKNSRAQSKSSSRVFATLHAIHRATPARRTMKTVYVLAHAIAQGVFLFHSPLCARKRASARQSGIRFVIVILRVGGAREKGRSAIARAHIAKARRTLYFGRPMTGDARWTIAR